MGKILELSDLQKVIDQRPIINIEDLSLDEGQIAAIVGQIDSGIEVLFDLLTGQISPTTGTVRIAGIDPAAQREAFSHQVGVIFAEDNLYKRLSALENLKFYCRLHRLPKTRAEQVLGLVGLGDHARIKVENLPPNMTRRLSYGRAILNEPELLLLAEPFEKCDQSSASLLSKLIRQQADEGTAVLILATEPSNLDLLCDVIYRLDHGSIVEAYNPQQDPDSNLPFMIPVRMEGKVALVDPSDILYAVAQDERTYLQTSDDLLPTQFTMAELEKRLTRSGFFRAHRGYLVNLQHVKEVIPYTRDSYTLKLKDDAGSEIPLSRAAARELRELLGF
jgi:ABC-2 type transport system ATP-binding protein